MSRERLWVAFVVGLLFCILIWVAVPYNNFALNNSFISDGYLPEIVLFCIALLVLGVNPLLGRLAPRARLSHRQLALIGSMLLMAAVLPSNGLLRYFPHCLALNTQQINASPQMAEAVSASRLPAALFPDPIAFGGDSPVSEQLVDCLAPGAAIPWAAWLPPLLAWGTVIAGFWFMMVGLGVVVYPQWRHNERLAFPLLRVYHALIDEPDEGRALPAVLRNRWFWTSAVTVMVLHSFNGLNLFTDGRFPPFPFHRDLSAAFTEGIWRYAPGFLKYTRFYFLFVGLAYFMPNRYSFSIWSMVLAAGLFVMGATQYLPTFDAMSLYDQGCGALIAIAVGVIWLGRQHYVRVLRMVFRRALPEDDRPLAMGGRLFIAGGAILFAWFAWAGAPVPAALFYVVIGAAIMLLIARIIAETGISYLWIIPFAVERLTSLAPAKWKTAATAYLESAHYILANRTSAVSVAVMMTLALGLERRPSPTSTRRLALVAIVVLGLGLLVCGAVHLHMGYNLFASYDAVNIPVTGRGARLLGLEALNALAMGRDIPAPPGRLAFMLFGFGLAAVLLWLCTRFPRWPLHPIGLIFVYSSIGLRLVLSLFLGWLLKTLIVRFGGARGYRAAGPVFLGFILGEALAGILWTMVPVIQILFGADPASVHHMVIFQYT